MGEILFSFYQCMFNDDIYVSCSPSSELLRVVKQRPTEPVERVRGSMLEVVNRTSLNASDYFTNFLKVKKWTEYLFRWLVNRV